MTIETTCKPIVGAGRCGHGCGNEARWTVRAYSDGLSTYTFACNEHRPDQEVHALRMFATMLEDNLAEMRAA